MTLAARWIIIIAALIAVIAVWQIPTSATQVVKDPAKEESPPTASDLLAPHSAVKLIEQEISISSRHPIVTREVSQAGSFGNLILSIVSEVDLKRDGTALLSAEINGHTALQISVERAGGQTTARYLTLTQGTRRLTETAGKPLLLDVMNFVQEKSILPGRSLVTFRVQSTADDDPPPLSWKISTKSQLIETSAPANELDVSIVHAEVSRYFDGDLKVPVKLTRNGSWRPRPARIVLTADQSSHELVIPADQSSAVFRLEVDETQEPIQLTAQVIDSFNEPRNFSSVVVPVRDFAPIILGIASGSIGLIFALLVLRRGSKRLIWPVVLIAGGVFFAGQGIGNLDKIQAMKPGYMEVTENPDASGLYTSAFPVKVARDFERRSQGDATVRQFLGRCDAVLAGEISGPSKSLFRIYEFGQERRTKLCDRAAIAIAGRPRGSQWESLRDGLLHARLEGTDVKWAWGYPRP